MDNKVTKARINEHLEYDWYKYLLIFVAVIIVVVFACKQINRSRDYEEINFFVSCYSYGQDDFQNTVLTEMNSVGYDSETYGDSVLREVEFNKVLLSEQEFTSLYSTQGIISSDALILPGSLADTNYRSFLPLTDEVLALILPSGESADDYEYLEKEIDGQKVRYGIELSSFGKLPFSIIAKQEDDADDKQTEPAKAYLVINPRSANIGSFGWRAKPQNLQTFFCVKLFLQYYK